MSKERAPRPHLYSALRKGWEVALFPFGGINVIGADKLPKEGPLLLAPSHRSLLDIPVLAIASERHIRFMAKKELFKPVFGRFIQNLGAFPVDRDQPGMGPIKTSVSILRDGEVLGIFPEGTRQTGREIGFLHSGVLRIAKMAGTEIYPVGIGGTETLTGANTVYIGDPISLEQISEDIGMSKVMLPGSEQEGLRHLRTALQNAYDHANAR
jgi:1-acyl-sn-glycerol-3-phosphate acyltransferase